MSAASAPTRIEPWRVAVTVLSLAAANAALLSAGPAAWIAVLFAWPVGVIYPIVLVAAIVALDFAIVWGVTRHRNVAAAVVSMLSGVILLVAIELQVGQIPIWWTGSFDLAPIVAGAVSGVVGALLLPVWWARVIGGVAALAAIAAFAIPAGIAGWEQNAQDAAEEEAAKQEYFDQLAASDVPPAVTEAPGYTLWDVQPADYDSIVFAISDSEGALRLDTIGESSDTGRDALGCWMISSRRVGEGTFDDSITLDDYAGDCEEVAPGRWELTDGSGLALIFDGELVLVRATDQETADAIGAEHPATASDLAVAAEHLRIISRDELREYLVHPIQDKTSAG